MAYSVPLSTSESVKSNINDLILGTSVSLKLVTLAKLMNESSWVNVGMHLLATVKGGQRGWGRGREGGEGGEREGKGEGGEGGGEREGKGRRGRSGQIKNLNYN